MTSQWLSQEQIDERMRERIAAQLSKDIAEWVREIREQCLAARVPFFFKCSGAAGGSTGPGGSSMGGRGTRCRRG